MPAEKIQANGYVPVDFGAVLRKHDLALEVPQQQAEKLDRPVPVEVIPAASEVHADPMASRRNRDRGDDRDPVLTMAVAKDRGMSDFRPSLPNVRSEHEASLVEEDQINAEPPGFFLYPANRPASIWRSTPPCVRSPVAPIWGKSILSIPEVHAGRPSVHAVPQNASRSGLQPRKASKGRWHTSPARHRRPKAWLASPSEPASALAPALESPSCASPSLRSADRLDFAAPQDSPMPSQPRRLFDRSRPSAATRSLSGDELLRAVLDCQEVLCLEP